MLQSAFRSFFDILSPSKYNDIDDDGESEYLSTFNCNDREELLLQQQHELEENQKRKNKSDIDHNNCEGIGFVHFAILCSVMIAQAIVLAVDIFYYPFLPDNLFGLLIGFSILPIYGMFIIRKLHRLKQQKRERARMKRNASSSELVAIVAAASEEEEETSSTVTSKRTSTGNRQHQENERRKHEDDDV